MSNSGGFAVARTHGSDRFYNPPAMRRPRLQREDKRIDSSESSNELTTLSNSRLDSASPTEQQASSTNLDRLMESVTPFVPVQLSEVSKSGWRTCEADRQPFFSLGDLWESYKEWSVYGVGVKLLLNGSDSINQYYVPSLSGIQLYIDPKRLRRPGEDNSTESSRKTNSAISSDCEAERHDEGVVDGKSQKWVQHNLNPSSQKMHKLSIRDKPPMSSSSSDETEICNSNRLLVFEYLEQEQPHHRQPLYDKVLDILSLFPELSMYRSCDLLPASWISVAWYPIYRIPMGQTLQNLDASFLTFHCLSTQCKGKGQLQQLHPCRGRKARASSEISLPVFGLASYKLSGSIVKPCGSNETQQANFLMQAADDWLRRLDVNLPDFQFFASHSPQWR